MSIGYISKEYTFWCGNEECGEWKQFTSDTKRFAIKMAKQEGWKDTKFFSWVCPKCSTNKQKGGEL